MSNQETLPLNRQPEISYSSLKAASYGNAKSFDSDDKKLGGSDTNGKKYYHIESVKGKSISLSTDSIPEEVTHLVPSKNVAETFHLVGYMLVLSIVIILGLTELYGFGRGKDYHAKQPIGPYQLDSRQVGEDFFNSYTFYEGVDSAGSNGYQLYVSRKKAEADGIVKILPKRGMNSFDTSDSVDFHEGHSTSVFLGTKATDGGPRDSIRLEGKVHYNRGLFILDLNHMPAGCGVWPAFWLSDEHNWPINGEIDILEGVNFQTHVKTAMHSTDGCTMENEPLGKATGTWDSAQGIPDAKTGIPDMTLRYATDCFVYDKHQWLNQGCVAKDIEDGKIGEPLNAKGGGVFALEWDPVNRHIRSWAFSPHSTVPPNLRESIATSGNSPDTRVLPDTEEWGLPFGYFAIGEGTNCSASHFKNMHLIINTAFCGSVAGNRYFMDCPVQHKEYASCNEYIASNPEALDEAYWEINGIYVYQREWI